MGWIILFYYIQFANTKINFLCKNTQKYFYDFLLKTWTPHCKKKPLQLLCNIELLKDFCKNFAITNIFLKFLSLHMLLASLIWGTKCWGLFRLIISSNELCYTGLKKLSHTQSIMMTTLTVSAGVAERRAVVV